MKVLLITPPHYVPLESFAVSVGQPLGIAYLGASLREAGHDVHLYDALIAGRMPGLTRHDVNGTETDRVRISNGIFERHPAGPGFPEHSTIIGASFDRIRDVIAEVKPDVVGISVIFTSIFKSGARIAELVKEVDPNIVTLMGGTHVTVSHESVIAHDSIDYVITGEAEVSMVAFLEALENERPVDGVLGVGYKDADGKTVYTPHELNWELDDLPMPAFDLLPMEEYFETMAEGRAVKMYTTRGCPFACSFCSVPLTSQRRFRVHSTERVLDEMRQWVADYDVDVVIFEDDNINTHAKRFRSVMQAVIDSEIDVRMDARNLRCDLLDDATLDVMKTAGFEVIWITPESGSQRVMDELINKKMKVAESRDAARRILAAGMGVGAAFVIGFPGETREEIQMTIDYARDLREMGVENFWFSIATPIEGTALYDRAMEMGLITGIDFDRFSYNTATYDTDQFTKDELLALRHQLMESLNDKAKAGCGKPMPHFAQQAAE